MAPAVCEEHDMDDADDADDEEVRRTHRAMIAEAGERRPGTPAGGVAPTAPSYADDTGVADLGVDEPVVPAPIRGAAPPSSTPTHTS